MIREIELCDLENYCWLALPSFRPVYEIDESAESALMLAASVEVEA